MQDTDYLDLSFTQRLLRRLAAGKRLAAAQLEHLEEGGFIHHTQGEPRITQRGNTLLLKGPTQ